VRRCSRKISWGKSTLLGILSPFFLSILNLSTDQEKIKRIDYSGFFFETLPCPTSTETSSPVRVVYPKNTSPSYPFQNTVGPVLIQLENCPSKARTSSPANVIARESSRAIISSPSGVAATIFCYPSLIGRDTIKTANSSVAGSNVSKFTLNRFARYIRDSCVTALTTSISDGAWLPTMVQVSVVRL
jgi:hypothetical protein